MAHIKVIHLELEGEHYYFGSPKAMFDVFGKSELGMTYNSFHSNIHLKEGVPYVNARKGYTIRLGYLGQAKTNRNNNLSERVKTSAVLINQNTEVPANENVDSISSTSPSSSMVTEQPALPVQENVNTTHKRKKKDKDIPEQLTLF